MMKRTIPVTHFAPGERVPIAIARRQAAHFKPALLPIELLTSVLNYVFVLNEQRQIVYASRNIPRLITRGHPRSWLGLRVGELLGCIHATEMEAGCGTSRSCHKCGALLAVLDSFLGKASLKEFRLTRFIGQEKHNLQFLALAAPLLRNGQKFSLLILTDGADTKARQAFKRLLGEMTESRRPE